MGLFSKVRDALSFKGIKKAAKTVAKTVKKVAKGVATSTPWGAKLWKEGGRLGKKVMKGIGKLGPVGIIAAQVVLSATGIGAGLAASLGSLWSSFGATAASAAANGSLLGSMANAVYNGVNYMGGTLGAVGDAISQGASKLIEGNFSGAATAFGKNMSRALTGTAGSSGIVQGQVSSAISAAQSNAGTGVLSQALDAGKAAMSPVSTAPLQSSMGANSVESLLGQSTGQQTLINAAPVVEQQSMLSSLLSGAGNVAKDVGKQLLTETAKNVLTPQNVDSQQYQQYPSLSPFSTQYNTIAAPTQQPTAVRAATIGGY